MLDGRPPLSGAFVGENSSLRNGVESSVISAVGSSDFGQGGEMGRNFFTFSMFYSK